MIKVSVVGYAMLIAAAGVSAPAAAKDPPSTTELLAWVACLKSVGVDPLSGQRSIGLLETAFQKCSAEESSLRQAIARDPSRYPEYNIENIKNILRAQQAEPKQ